MSYLLRFFAILLLLGLGLNGKASAETDEICSTQDGLEVQFHSQPTLSRMVIKQRDSATCDAELESGRFCSICRGTPSLDASFQLSNCSGSLVVPSTELGRDQIWLRAGIHGQLRIDGTVSRDARNVQVIGFNISRRNDDIMGSCLFEKPITLRHAIKMMTGRMPADDADGTPWWKNYRF